VRYRTKNRVQKLLLLLIVFTFVGALSMGVSFVGAQLVVWGLSAMGVSSGIWGPYLILTGMSFVIGTSTAVNSARK
jgi:hypothetical protein